MYWTCDHVRALGAMKTSPLQVEWLDYESELAPVEAAAVSVLSLRYLGSTCASDLHSSIPRTGPDSAACYASHVLGAREGLEAGARRLVHPIGKLCNPLIVHTVCPFSFTLKTLSGTYFVPHHIGRGQFRGEQNTAAIQCRHCQA